MGEWVKSDRVGFRGAVAVSSACVVRWKSCTSFPDCPFSPLVIFNNVQFERLILSLKLAVSA